MISLDEFSCSLKIYGEEEQAFRMDGESDKDMRPLAGLGPCEICDYFIIRDHTITLIEKTDIADTEGRLNKICGEWRDRANANKFIDNSIRDENVLKVFGSLLVLCRLASKCEDIKNKDKYDFWLVDDVPSDNDKNDNEEHLKIDDNLKDRLRGHLAKALTDKVIGKVVVLPHDVIKFTDSK